MGNPDAADFVIPEDQLGRYAAMTRGQVSGTAVYQMHVPDEELPELEERPEMAYVSPRMKLLWKYIFHPGAMQNISYEGHYPSRIAEIYTQMTKVLHDNGARMVLGADADNPYLVPGASLLDELELPCQCRIQPIRCPRCWHPQRR